MAPKSKQLSEVYTQKILEEIKSGIYANSTRLPSENEIASYFGISRTLVRDCLAKIEREGFISRKHGVGTIINQHVLEVKTRMDLEQEFLEMIRSADKIPNIENVNFGEIEADAQIATALKICEGDIVLFSERIISADGENAIYCIDYLSKKNIKSKDYDLSLLEKPIFEFLEKYCDLEIYMDLSQVKAILASEKLSQVLNIRKGDPILYIDEIGYTLFGKPVLYSKEYYRDGVLNHTVLRKKI